MEFKFSSAAGFWHRSSLASVVPMSRFASPINRSCEGKAKLPKNDHAWSPFKLKTYPNNFHSPANATGDPVVPENRLSRAGGLGEFLRKGKDCLQVWRIIPLSEVVFISMASCCPLRKVVGPSSKWPNFRWLHFMGVIRGDPNLRYLARAILQVTQHFSEACGLAASPSTKSQV